MPDRTRFTCVLDVQCLNFCLCVRQFAERKVRVCINFWSFEREPTPALSGSLDISLALSSRYRFNMRTNPVLLTHTSFQRLTFTIHTAVTNISAFLVTIVCF